ncbi:MAG TPA: hypothetical protein VH985_14440, partial [Candidatus Binatia bacterium]
DTLAPEQFYATLRRTHFIDPERRLMAALLEDAVACLARDPGRCSHRQRRYFEEAQAWIQIKEGEDWIFSFTNVCETLGFNADYLRSGLTRWSAQSAFSASPKLRLKKYRSGTRRRKLRLRSAS